VRQQRPATRHGPVADAAVAANVLLERDTELAALDAALAAARSGSGQLVVLRGEAGIGKSGLLRAARERARAQGMLVLGASGLELEQEFAFGFVLRLLQPTLDSLAPAEREYVLGGRAATAAALLDGHPPVSQAQGTDHGYSLVYGLRWLIVNLTRLPGPGGDGRPGLVVVDDAHWCDVSSLRLLAHLSAGIEALPLTVVVAARTGMLDARSALLEGLAGQPGATVLRPRALSEDGAARLVRSVFPDAAPAFWRACARVTGGNPFYLRELLASARADGLSAGAEAAADVARLAPESVIRSVILRMAGLPHQAPALASAVAVLGDRASLRHAAALAGLDSQSAELAADTLAAAHILAPGEPLSFVHPLIGAAVHADIPALSCSRAHRRAAGLLDDDEAPAETVAAHLLACRPDGDPRTVEVLAAAAARASGRGEHLAARRFLRRALAEPPPAGKRGGLSVELALADAAVGSADAVARVRAALTLVGDRDQRARVLGALARLLFARSEFAAAGEAADLAMAEIDPADPLAGELLAHRLVIAAVGLDAGTVAGARFEEMMAAAEPPAEPALLAQLAHAALAAGAPASRVRELAKRALAGLGGDDGFYGIIGGTAVMALLYVDELDLAAAAIDRALAQARHSGSLMALGTATHQRTELLYYQGQLAGAVATAQQTLDVCRAGCDLCVGRVVPVLAEAHLDRGEFDAARQALDLLADFPKDRVEHVLALIARGRLALAQEDPAAALCHLRAAGDLADRLGLVQPTMFPWRIWASAAAAQLGNRQLALDLAQVALERARAAGVPRTLGAALRVAGLAAGGGPGEELLAEAVSVLRRSPSALERARALVELGIIRRESGHHAAAREPLRQGLELAETLGAAPLAARARAALHAVGGRQRAARHVAGDDALTAAERRIAELAAQGLTTAQIAKSLYLSPKTVDWHLGHVYQKLGVSSRRKLATALADRVLNDPYLAAKPGSEMMPVDY
jgi:DNA-binding CsgD family transcriptional regulator